MTNTPAQEKALLDLLIRRFDAVEVPPPGLERARMYAGQAQAEAPSPFDHAWFWKTKLPERKGQQCRVVTRGAKNSILVEFEDGQKVVTSRHAVRALSEGDTVDSGVLRSEARASGLNPGLHGSPSEGASEQLRMGE